MAFQGFARETGFSTNQIKIDIDSVINRDLEEASRQSKRMGRNAALQEKWSGMYLNAMINKHKVEEDNRKSNFNEFIKNREEIQKQIRYNNDIKYQDASREKPAPLSETINKKLFEFAVKAGSLVIQKHMAKKREAEAQEKTQKKKEAIGAYQSLLTQAQTPEQRQQIRETVANWANYTREQKDEIINGMTFLRQGENLIHAEAFGHASGLTEYDRQGVEFSKENIARDIQQFMMGPGGTQNISGKDFSLTTITQGVNSNTETAYWAGAKEAYWKSRIPTGLGHEFHGRASEQWEKLEAGWRKDGFNANYKNAVLAEKTSQYSQVQKIQDDHGINGVIKWIKGVDPTTGGKAHGSPFYHGVGGYGAGLNVLLDMGKAGMFNRDQINEIMNHSGLQKGDASLNEQLGSKTPSAYALEWKKVRDNMVIQGHKDLQNQQLAADLKGEEIITNVKEGKLSQDVARNLFHQLNPDSRGPLSQVSAALSTEVKNRLFETLRTKAGITEEVPVLSVGHKHAEKLFPKSEAKTWAGTLYTDSETGKPVSISLSDGENVKKVQEQSAYLFKNWVAELIDSKGWDPADPRVKGVILNKLDDPEDDDVRRLASKLQLETKNPETGIVLPNGPRLKGFTFRDITSDGVAQYTKLRAENLNRQIGLNEINYDGIKSWVKSISSAIENDSIDQQNALGRGNVLVNEILRTNSTATAGGIYNAAVKYFKKQGMDYQILPESQYLNAKELNDLNKKYGHFFSKASQPLKNQLLNSGVKFNSGRHSNLASTWGQGVVETYGMTEMKGDWVPLADHSGDNAHLDIKFETPEQNQWMYDYLAANGVVTTEVKGRGAGVTVPHSTAGPYTHAGGHGMDIPMDGRNGLKPGPVGTAEDRAFIQRVQNLIRKGSAIYHAQQRQITPQQVIPVPSGIGLTPWTPEGNTPTQPSTGFSGIDTLLKHSETEQGRSFSDTIKNHYQNQKG